MSASVFARGIKGMVWAAGENFGAAAVSMLAFLVLARLLEPRDFGVVALAGAVVYFVNLVIGHGFAEAVVQRAEIKPAHLDTAFWSTMALGLGLAALCAAASDLLARTVGEPAAAPILVWLALAVPAGALATVPASILRREMRFQHLAMCTVLGRAVGALTGVGMAFAGFGAWSLVGHQIAGNLAVGAITFAASNWCPAFRFSLDRFKDIGWFGFHVSASQLVTGGAEQALNLLIGAFFGSTTLGYFNIAWRTVQLFRSLFTGPIYQVGFSTFARLQHDVVAVAGGFLKATQLSCLVGFPLAIGVAIVAEPLVAVLFGPGWGASAPLLAALAVEMLPGFFGIFLSACYRALDRAETVLWMSLVYLVVGIGAVLSSAWAGVVIVTIAWVARSFLLMPVHVVLMGRILRTGPGPIVKLALAPASATLIMGLSTFAVREALTGQVTDVVLVVASAGAGLLTYSLAIALLAPNLLRTALRTVKVMVSSAQADVRLEKAKT